MVARYWSASPSSWRPTARTLGALFAGSAVTLSATLVHGGAPLLTGDEAGSIAEPSANPTVAEPQQLPPVSSTASLSSPGQAAPWTPGAAPQWGSSLRDLPVRRAPVQEAPRQPASRDSVAAASAGPTTPRHAADDAHAGNAGFGAAAPQAADPQQGRSFDGLLGSVFHVMQELPR
jgi:hypothetical protein